jgi:hypothetical protein
MSLNDATPADWNKLKKEHPAIVPGQEETDAKMVYAHMALEEGNEIEKYLQDMVNSPAHYQSESGIECIDAITAALTPDELKGHYKATVIKYLWRAGVKSKSKEGEDFSKAAWYLERLQKMC